MVECTYNQSCFESTKQYLHTVNDEPFSFKCDYFPTECFWGKASSKILYIGVNPYKDKIGGNNHFPLEILRNGPGENSYFGTIHKWYPLLYEDIGKEGGVAFTDLVKCSSPTFPFNKMKVNDLDRVFKNCRTHLDQQIRLMARQNLQVVVISGIHPCWHILDMYFPEINNFDKTIDCVSNKTIIEGKTINFVFFRKFMGRRDVSKRYRDTATQLLKDLI